jgi:hypothetical protein
MNISAPQSKIVVAGLLALFLLTGVSSVNAQAPPKKTFWKFYLYRIGKKLNCQFTFEELARPDEDLKINAYVVEDDAIDSIDEVIAKISKEVKGVTIRRSEDHPRVVHIIDDRLKALKGYALDEKIDLTYSGALDQLPGEIGKQVRHFGIKLGGDLLVGDHVSQVVIDVKDQQVRRILTDSMPREKYNSFLWWTETNLVGDEPKTVVQFYGGF